MKTQQNCDIAQYTIQLRIMHTIGNGNFRQKLSRCFVVQVCLCLKKLLVFTCFSCHGHRFSTVPTDDNSLLSSQLFYVFLPLAFRSLQKALSAYTQPMALNKHSYDGQAGFKCCLVNF
jgi:hypothetical protein